MFKIIVSFVADRFPSGRAEALPGRVEVAVCLRDLSGC